MFELQPDRLTLDVTHRARSAHGQETKCATIDIVEEIGTEVFADLHHAIAMT